MIDTSCKIASTVTIHQPVNIYKSDIGAYTRVAAFVEIGGATIGERCKIQAHAYICPGVMIEDEVFIGPRVTFTNDRHPRATRPCQLEETLVKRGASIGAGAVIMCGITIGEDAMIGAGAVVTRDVPNGATATGNPARIAEASTLGPLSFRDSELLFSWINNAAESVAPFRPISLEDHEQWLRDAILSGSAFAIRVDERLVGCCQLTTIDSRARSAELRIRIGDEADRSCGHGERALRGLLRHGFETMNLNRIWLHVDTSNHRARHLYEKLGFRSEGVSLQAIFSDGRFRDIETMAVLRDQR